MNSKFKISELINKIKDKTQSNFEENLDALLSLCESDIEKQFLLQTIFHLETRTSLALETASISNSIYFIDDMYNNNYILGIEYDYGLEPNKIKKSLETGKLVLPLASEYHNVIRIYPQFKVEINNSVYILDFAFYVERWHTKKDKLHETRKIAIECDGYDYHKDPVKFKQDKIRERALKSNGWKDVLRYSGSEIYEISNDLVRSHSNFKEILNTIMF